MQKRHSKHNWNTKLNPKLIIHPPNLESPVNRRIASFGQWEETRAAAETHAGSGGGRNCREKRLVARPPCRPGCGIVSALNQSCHVCECLLCASSFLRLLHLWVWKRPQPNMNVCDASPFVLLWFQLTVQLPVRPPSVGGRMQQATSRL